MNGAFTFLLTIIFPALLSAQEVEMADTMRSEGKIYALVAIIVVILVGLITYLIMIDRKVSKIEKEIDQGS